MPTSKEAAFIAGEYLCRSCLPSECKERPLIGLVLGTGWGDLPLSDNDERKTPLSEVPGFSDIRPLPGHHRLICSSKVGKHYVVALRGRIHLNEAPHDPNLAMMVRLQVEMLYGLGVRTFILTNAAGGLAGRAEVGNVVVTDGFVSLYAPDMPMYAGEFCSPDDVLDPGLRTLAMEIGSACDLTMHEGGYAMVRGPFFEGRKYDKKLLRDTGAHCVGMSTLPEACVLSLYEGVRVLCLSYITNDDKEVHSHEENVRRAQRDKARLNLLLKHIVDKL